MITVASDVSRRCGVMGFAYYIRVAGGAVKHEGVINGETKTWRAELRASVLALDSLEPAAVRLFSDLSDVKAMLLGNVSYANREAELLAELRRAVSRHSVEVHRAGKKTPGYEWCHRASRRAAITAVLRPLANELKGNRDVNAARDLLLAAKLPTSGKMIRTLLALKHNGALTQPK